MNWRLVHIWLRGRDDALLRPSGDRAHCYTAEAKDTYVRGWLAGLIEAGRG